MLKLKAQQRYFLNSLEIDSISINIIRKTPKSIYPQKINKLTESHIFIARPIILNSAAITANQSAYILFVVCASSVERKQMMSSIYKFQSRKKIK